MIPTDDGVVAPPDRDRSGASTYTPILVAALDAFNEHGYHGASVRDIARRVGVNVPSLYYHHENKENMLFELLLTSILHLKEGVRAAYDSSEDPGERFRRVVQRLARHTAGNTNIVNLSTELRSLAPESRRTYVQHRAEIESILHATIDGGLAAGVLTTPHPQDTTRAILGMVQHIATWYHEDRGPSIHELADRYVQLASRIVGLAEPAGPDVGR